MNTCLAGILLVGNALLSAPALAHARLTSSVPPAGAAVATAPGRVPLSFSEALEARFSSVMVADAAGLRVDRNDLAPAAGDARTLLVDLKPLGAGRYTVTWRAVSVDTHRTHGSYSFSVAP